jgi:serine/threonine protein kinase
MGINPRRINKYELQTRLGYGGMAEVWKALDAELHRYVAIKLLHADLQNDPNFVTRFEREAQLIASLHHPNIVKIYDFHVSRPPETPDTVAYMVMDYVEGRTLAQYLRATSHTGKFPTSEELVHLFSPICLAVSYAHQKGMIHRDIKPSNILLDQRGPVPSGQGIGEPILSDFGIAKLLGTSTNHHSGWWLGTPYYTSPEQALGAQGNERSDIYALCVVLYEVCTGVPPFQSDNPTAIIMQHINALPPPPSLINPRICPALAAVILRGLAKRPEDRFPSATSLGIAIAEAVSVPAPESLRQMDYQIAEMNNPTVISPIRPWVALSQPLGSSPMLGESSGSSPAPPMSSSPTLASSSGPITPPPSAFTPAQPQSFHSSAPLGQSQAFFPRPSEPPGSSSQKRGGGKGIRILLALILIFACLGVLLFIALKVPAPSPVSQVVGQAFFISSGQLNTDNSKGINDEVLLDLQNIPAPQSGKAYYGWLLGDKTQSEFAVTSLGRLTLNHGNVHLLYINNQHVNLLAYQSRILITEEDAAVTPAMYVPDYQAWKYYAEISQAPSPRDKLHFSMLDHLRHLLSESPELKRRNLHGGLDMWFLRNTQKILEWASAARDEWRNNPDLLHRQIIRILDYIDGESFVQQDAPAVGPALYVDPNYAQVALLGQPPDGQDPPGYSFDDEVPPGYVYLVASHLAATVLSPDATPEQRALAAQIHTGLDKVRGWLENVHQDSKKLITMDETQLAQDSSLLLLDDLVTQAQLAYTGQTDPLTGQLQGGAIWVTSSIERMATFNLKPYVGKQ